MSALGQIDSRLFEWINGLAGKIAIVDSVMIAIAKFSPFVVALVLVALWLSWRLPAQRASALAGAAALLALGLGQFIGRVFPRLRPSDVLPTHLLIPHSADTSFPSDHATLVFAVATVLWHFDRRLGILCLLFGLITALARVWVGAHYPGDVIGGGALGILSAALVWRLARGRVGMAILDRSLKSLGKVRLAASSGD